MTEIKPPKKHFCHYCGKEVSVDCYDYSTRLYSCGERECDKSLTEAHREAYLDELHDLNDQYWNS